MQSNLLKQIQLDCKVQLEVVVVLLHCNIPVEQWVQVIIHIENYIDKGQSLLFSIAKVLSIDNNFVERSNPRRVLDGTVRLAVN